MSEVPLYHLQHCTCRSSRPNDPTIPRIPLTQAVLSHRQLRAGRCRYLLAKRDVEETLVGDYAEGYQPNLLLLLPQTSLLTSHDTREAHSYLEIDQWWL